MDEHLLPQRVGTMVNYKFLDPEFGDRERKRYGLVLLFITEHAFGYDWLVLTDDGEGQAIAEEDIVERVFMHIPCEDCGREMGRYHSDPKMPGGHCCIEELMPIEKKGGGIWACPRHQQQGRARV